MNISRDISIYESNVSHFFFNGTEVNDFEVSSVIHIINILMSFPINSYVIWLIVTGTGNGLASEFFIFNHCVCGILFSLETLLVFLINVFPFPWIVVAFLDGIPITGRPLFECLICVERYLAVVHPVTFLKYKPLRHRLICSTVAWLTTVVSGGFNAVFSFELEVYFIYVLMLFLVFHSIQLYCCLAVLGALKQSGPGERGREREENHMKRRAFHLILITTVSTVIIYTPFIIYLVLITSENKNILMCFAQLCFTLAGLVEPVLFLYRVGNFIKCQ